MCILWYVWGQRTTCGNWASPLTMWGPGIRFTPRAFACWAGSLAIPSPSRLPFLRSYCMLCPKHGWAVFVVDEGQAHQDEGSRWHTTLAWRFGGSFLGLWDKIWSSTCFDFILFVSATRAWWQQCQLLHRSQTHAFIWAVINQDIFLGLWFLWIK